MCPNFRQPSLTKDEFKFSGDIDKAVSVLQNQGLVVKQVSEHTYLVFPGSPSDDFPKNSFDDNPAPIAELSPKGLMKLCSVTVPEMKEYHDRVKRIILELDINTKYPDDQEYEEIVDGPYIEFRYAEVLKFANTAEEFTLSDLLKAKFGLSQASPLMREMVEKGLLLEKQFINDKNRPQRKYKISDLGKKELEYYMTLPTFRELFSGLFKRVRSVFPGGKRNK